MPEQTILNNAANGFNWLLGLFVGLLGYNLKRSRTQLDDHEKNHVTKTDFNETLKSLRGDIKDGFGEMKTDIRVMHQRIDNIDK